MGSAAARLIDWDTAAEVGERVAGPGPALTAVDRARVREDLAGAVPRAEALVSEFTGLRVDGFRCRAWVMSRGEWIRANTLSLERLLEPLARRILAAHPNRSDLRRKVLGAQIGLLLGYVSRKVLGQYDVFLPPDDEGLIYFVGSNLAEVRYRQALPAQDLHLWVALHEVTHRLQFGGTPWLPGYLLRQVNAYLDTAQLDTKQLVEQLKRATAEIRAGVDWRASGALSLLLTPEQQGIFRRVQAVMSLLEGHATFVMNRAGAGRVRDLERMRRALRERRRANGLERAFQRAIGFESKVRQYDVGERFVTTVVERSGMEGLNLVWADEANLPTADEIVDPGRWLARVAAA
jgi:coenzyme F420 biosynthesis associated uncharacterized protein